MYSIISGKPSIQENTLFQSKEISVGDSKIIKRDQKSLNWPMQKILLMIFYS